MRHPPPTCRSPGPTNADLPESPTPSGSPATRFRRTVVGVVSATLLTLAGTQPQAAEPTTLTSAEATSLVSAASGALVLDSVTSLPPDAALGLARQQNGLSLDGLARLDAATARALALHGRLSEEGSPDFDAEALLEQLGGLFTSGEDGGPDLEGLEAMVSSLVPEAAAPPAEDAEDRDPWLSLGGLRTLSADVAAALAVHTGPLLLDGLQSLSESTARALAAHSGELSLAGLTSISPEVRAALEDHDGPVVLPDSLLTPPDGS